MKDGKTMWVVRIETDPNDDDVECVFLVNTETGERDRQEGLGWYLDHLREDDDFDEELLVETYKKEAQWLADRRNNAT